MRIAAAAVLKGFDLVHGLAREIKVPTPAAGRAAAPFQILVAKGQGERAVIAVLKPQQASVSRAPAAGLGGIAVEPYHDRRYLEPDGGKMRKPRGVVITPFDETGQRVGSAVRHGLQALGVEIFYFDELHPGASWANAVSDAIGSADFIVADISRPNANVLYEPATPTLCVSRASCCAAGMPTAVPRRRWSATTTLLTIRAI